MDGKNWLGLAAWRVLMFVFAVVPFVFLPYPRWLVSLLFLAVLTYPLLGMLVGIAAYVRAFFVVIHEPFGLFSAVYFIGAAFYIIVFGIPMIRSLFDRQK